MPNKIEGVPVLPDFDFDELNHPDFKEDSVREELILPILRALGYSSKKPYKITRSKKLLHPIVSIGSKQAPITNYPDYLFEVNGKYAWVLDAKGPSEDIFSGSNKQQAYFYAIHPEIDVQLYALCNGRDFVVYRVNETKAVLNISLTEIARRWNEIENLLGPRCFNSDASTPTAEHDRRKNDFDYLERSLLPEIKGIRKQSAKRHYGIHGYFTKQAHQIVQAYIENFSKPGDLVLDPFGGTGVTAVEALIKDRRAIHVDLNPLSTFWVGTLLRPVNISEVVEAYETVSERFLDAKPTTTTEVKRVLRRFPYPKGIGLPESADVDTVEQLFSPLQLAHLALLRHLIKEITNENVRDHLLLSFSSSINKFNLTFHYTKSEGGGDSGAFRYYRYRIAESPGNLDLMTVFETKVKRLISAKRELSRLISNTANYRVVKGSATNLSFIPDESIDYIYTDPPYGAKIHYLDLSTIFNSWLELDVTEEDRDLEAIEGGERKKSKTDYEKLITTSISEMFRVLKFDRWMSFVFQHQNPAYWHLIVDAAEKAGFEYAGAVRQNNGQTSFKKRQNPFTVLSGQLIINFRKVKNPQTMMKANLGWDVTEIIHQSIEDIIARHSGATIEEINDEIVIKFMEFNILDVVAKKYKDLSPFLTANFDYDEVTKQFHLKKETKFRAKIPVEVRIKYYLLSMMRRSEREGKYMHIDDIYLEIMPLLKNGKTPRKQTILSVLESLAVRTGEDQWKLVNSDQRTLFDLG